MSNLPGNQKSGHLGRSSIETILTKQRVGDLQKGEGAPGARSETAEESRLNGRRHKYSFVAHRMEGSTINTSSSGEQPGKAFESLTVQSVQILNCCTSQKIRSSTGYSPFGISSSSSAICHLPSATCYLPSNLPEVWLHISKSEIIVDSLPIQIRCTPKFTTKLPVLSVE